MQVYTSHRSSWTSPRSAIWSDPKLLDSS